MEDAGVMSDTYVRPRVADREAWAHSNRQVALDHILLVLARAEEAGQPAVGGCPNFDGEAVGHKGHPLREALRMVPLPEPQLPVEGRA